MPATFEWVKRPAPTTDPRATNTYRTRGGAIGAVGLMVVMIALIASLVGVSRLDTDPSDAATIFIWNFGLSVTGLAILKTAIAVVLAGIVMALWLRVESVKTSLAALKPDGAAKPPAVAQTIDTPFGKATAARDAPKPLAIHTLARVAWLPMLVMGGMAVVIGLILSIAASGDAAATESSRELWAWAQGTQFLGEGLVLSGIAFLLGTILAGLRSGGGEVQESLGVPVLTLKMPPAVKAFIGLMMAGMMIAIVQFILYGIAAQDAADTTVFATWAAWLGPLREFALGVLLVSIVLALYSIGNVLGFQFRRIREIITTGT